MSRGSKGTTALDLLLIAVVFFIGMGLFLLADFLVAKDIIISKKTIYVSMDIDDAGSEVISLLGSTSLGSTNMRVLGDSQASNKEQYIKDRLNVLLKTQSDMGGYSMVSSRSYTTTVDPGTPLSCILENTDSKGQDLIWPMPGQTAISSEPGWRIHPHYGDCRCHSGVDIPGGGLDVLATQSGVVETAGGVTGYGNTVIISHEGDWEGYRSLYGHLDRILVEPGQRVSQGENIGISGNTGLSVSTTGGDSSHLHFELTRNGERVDPCQFIPGSPADCTVLDRCTAFEAERFIMVTQIPIPGARQGNLKTSMELVR